MTIPSALALLVNIFTEPSEQARAIGIFVGCGGVGSGKFRRSLGFSDCSLLRSVYGMTLTGFTSTALGLIISAIFVQFASWSWIFWFGAIVCMPIAGLSVFLIPKQEPRVSDFGITGGAKWKSLDLLGVSILTG